MIGQTELRRHISKQISHGTFPRFSVLIGEKGSGKKLLAKEIAKELKCAEVGVTFKVDDIREMIENAYKVELPVVYVIADCDNMSQNAANAILKVTEEPPNNAYFILTCENLDNLLPTIKSRGVTYMMAPYTYEEKCDSINSLTDSISDDDEEFILEVSSNLGDIKSLMGLNVSEFRDYVNLVIDNIAEVSGSNAFKIDDKVGLKDEEDKYDVRLFWKAFSAICASRMVSSTESDECLHYGRAIAITGDALQQLSIRGINKQMLFDTWILDMRSEWL